MPAGRAETKSPGLGGQEMGVRGGRGQSKEEFGESSDADRSRNAGSDGVLGLEPRVGTP